ncbi:hypothetical protein [Clostridium sp. BJN0001]|uniref:hypothetical protein n=1 Tax=Clostridium sp. BJN0001 TaxID=2930219 RepID=UPI001FD3AD98|nr:hypothetical protein [Clostridium sp. BJN0001]
MNEKIEVCRISEDFLNNNFQKKLSYHIIESILYFLTVYPVVACINYGINNNKNDIYMGLFLIIPIIVMIFFMMKIKDLKLFIIFLFSFTAISIFVIGFLLRKYPFAVILLIFAYKIFKNSLKKQNVKFSLFTFFVLEILLIPQNIIALISKINELSSLIMIISVIILIISLMYLIKIRNTKLSMEGSDNLSGSKSNNIFVLSFGILIAVFMICVSLSGVFKVTSYADKKVVNTITNLFNINYVQKAFDYQKDDNNNGDKNDLLENIFGSKMLKNEGEISDSVKIVFDIIEKIIFTVIVLIFMYFILNKIMILFKAAKNIEKITFVYKEEKNNKSGKEKVNKQYKNIIKNVFLSNKDKARKLYKNKILKFRKDQIIISNNDTVGDIQNKILRKTNHNIEEISSIYNKIRYSNKEVTNKDIDKIRNSK